MSDPTRQAAAWLARRQGAPLDEPAQRAFEAWLTEDLDHGLAYVDAERAWAAAGAALDDPRVKARCVALAGQPLRRRIANGAMAAALALAVFGSGGLWTIRYLTGPKPLAAQVFHTDVGQRSTVSLPDGSVVTLNTDTVVRTRSDGVRRLVYLDKGQAYFRVAKDSRHPFVVTAAGRTVTALGTAFDVRLDGRELKVVLVEGKVRVEGLPADPPAPRAGAPSKARKALAPGMLATELLAGSQLVIPPNAEWRLTRANTERETSWIRGQIVFDDEPLGNVVAELNRYSNQKMIIDDPALAARSISGAFKPGDVRGFSRSLEAYRYAYISEENGRALHFAPLKGSKKNF